MLRDWAAVADVIVRWRRLHLSWGRLPKKHTRMELLEFEVEYNSPETFGSIPNAVHECVSDASASPRHRLAAAALAMISADNHGDESSATDIYGAIQGIPLSSTSDRIHRLTVDAIFHAGFGDLTRAPRLLRTLVSEALTLSQPASRAAHVRRACFGLARYDDPHSARQLLLGALETFERLAIWTQAIVCVEDLGVLAISAGDYEDAAKWIAKAEEMKTLGNDVFCASVEYELRIILAFETMDASALPRFSLPGEVSEAFLRPARSRQIHFALLAAGMIVSGNRRPLTNALEELAILHARMKCRGHQDLTAAVLATGLAEIGRRDEAATLLAAYVKSERRERVAPPPSIQRIGRELGLVQPRDGGPPDPSNPCLTTMRRDEPSAPH
jgi:hypothetical protein